MGAEDKIKQGDLRNHAHSGHDRDHDHDHDHDHGTWLLPTLSFVLLISGLVIEYIFKLPFFKSWIRIIWYAAAYIPVAFPVLKMAWKSLGTGNVFNEFFLMSIATLGAFAIGEYPEGVAVMLFYTIGELLQAYAVKRSKNNIKALLDVRPNIAHVWRNQSYTRIHPKEVQIGEQIQVLTGEKIPLDGELISSMASLNTAAISGESKPKQIQLGEAVYAGSINMGNPIEIKSSHHFSDSSIARIIDMVQHASNRKSKTELLIRRLAKVYTPIVVYLAIAILILPWFFTQNYVFTDWLYRALIFLVISCPCALVISIPLGYFGGLGAASRKGILFKGASYLDQFSKIKTLLFDKTGTVTEGVFEIKEFYLEPSLDQQEITKRIRSLESKSTHPIAKAIMEQSSSEGLYPVSHIIEFPGKGIKGVVQEQEILIGNPALMKDHGIKLRHQKETVETLIYIAIADQCVGYIIIADRLKENADKILADLKKVGVEEFHMLSGDKDSITQKVAKELGIANAKGDLFPADKLAYMEKHKKENQVLAFVGDGINDAPVLAGSDIGIAMGGMGSDVAIETADVVIQTDEPSKIVEGIKIAKFTQSVIWQNITLALGVKIIVLILGALGYASMWAAVFADVGVALLAILNSIRVR